MATVNNMPVSYDFNDTVYSLINFLKQTDEFKDYNYDGSAIKELMRLLSFNAQMSAFRANFMFNEMDMSTADLRENVVSNASTYGYVPSSKIGATLLVDVTVVPDDINNAATSITITKDNGFFAAKDGVAYTFYPQADVNVVYDSVNYQYLFSALALKQGKWLYQSFTVQTQSGVESFELTDSDIDITTLTVSVYPSGDTSNFTIWNQVSSGYDLGSDSEYFFLKENRSGNYEIEFGDGTLLKKPDYGSIIVCRYMTVAGEIANSISKVTPSGAVGGYYNVTVTTTDGASSYGGSEVEDIESIRQAAPLNFQSLGNAVTDTDYVALTKKLYSNVSDVIAYGGDQVDPPKYGYTYIAIKPKTSETLTTAQKLEVYNILKKVNVGSITPIIVDPSYTYIGITHSFTYNSKKTILSNQAMESKFHQGLISYSADKLEKFNKDFSYTDLIAYVKNIDKSVIDFTITTSYEKRFVPTLNVSGVYSFNFAHDIIPGSVLIKNFTITDTDYIGYKYTMYDDSNGNISLYKTKGTNIVTITKNIGTVNYTTGVINLSGFVPASITADYVQILVSPVRDDQSLTGIRDSILEIGTISVTAEAKNV